MKNKNGEILISRKQAAQSSLSYLEPEDIAKTLFIISCSARKSSKHEKEEKWLNVTQQQEYSKFQEFTPLRKQLMEFYSTIHSEEVAEDTYRGFKYQNPSRWKRAWKTNKELPSSCISRAINRYTGKLYTQLNPTVRRYLANNILSNVLIISALHGPTLPSDYLPYYDLTMQDLWKDKATLKNRWPLWVRDQSSEKLRTFVSKFEQAYVMVGNDYKPTARAIKATMPNLKRYREAPSSRSQSNTIWGQQLNKHLLTLINSQ